jgi:hypothetical protein
MAQAVSGRSLNVEAGLRANPVRVGFMVHKVAPEKISPSRSVFSTSVPFF